MNRRLLAAGISVFLLVIAGFILFKVASAVIVHKDSPTANDMKSETGTLLFERCEKLISEGELVKARNACLRIMEKFPDSANVQKVQETLDDLNIKILFSPIITKDSFIYEVQKGDSITKIAKNFGTTAELIIKANGLKDNSLRIGKRLKITKAKFSIVVDKSQTILTLKADKDIIKTYRIATGKNDSTPVGNFTITSRIIDPPWYPPTGGMIPAGDPKNVLGSRWLGLSKPSYGIHGTTQPESIGKSVTEGCVRLKNADVEELYTIVPTGTEVVIVE